MCIFHLFYWSIFPHSVVCVCVCVLVCICMFGPHSFLIDVVCLKKWHSFTFYCFRLFFFFSFQLDGVSCTSADWVKVLFTAKSSFAHTLHSIQSHTIQMLLSNYPLTFQFSFFSLSFFHFTFAVERFTFDSWSLDRTPAVWLKFTFFDRLPFNFFFFS